MKSSLKLSIFLFGFLISMLFIQFSYADVFIPNDEFIGYYDYHGIFTVVGNVKNTLNYTVIPTISVSIIDDSELFTKIIQHVPLNSGKEIPFRIKFPEVIGDSPNLLPANLSIEKTHKDEIRIDVLYDKSLVKHDDGHLTGRIQNNGDKTIYNPKIFAVIHGYEQVLDIAQNIEFIEKLDPGEITEFSMYPDPSITEEIFYYSCFAPVDSTVIPITTKKNNGNYDFRYDSGAWYSGAKFNDDGTTLSIRGYNSYPLETYANFEFPPITGKEKFFVTLNDEPIDFIQSIDEMGFWHVAFTVEPTSQGILKISGFEAGLPPELPVVPKWIKLNANWWSSNEISDSEFLDGIDFLIEKEIIYVNQNQISESERKIPQWVKTPAKWWFEEKISDDNFLNIIENLIQRKIIKI